MGILRCARPMSDLADCYYYHPVRSTSFSLPDYRGHHETVNRIDSIFRFRDGNFMLCQNAQLPSWLLLLPPSQKYINPIYPVKQAIPRESPNTIITNTCVVRSNGERTSQLMFHVPRGLMKRFSGAFLISISLPATDLECLIRNLIL